MTTDKPLTYVDDDGHKLYGYSQANLDRLYKILWVLALILFAFFCLLIFIVYKTIHWKIIGKLIAAIGKC